MATLEPLIVITVPHAPCPERIPEGSHPCDLASPGAANLLHSVSRRHFRDVELLEADVPRTIADQNRPWGRGTQFRNRVATLVVDGRSAGRSVYVIDVHSFPSNEKGWNEYDVVVIDPRPDYAPSFVTFRSDATMDLYEFLRDEGKDVEYVPGSQLNDIVVTSRDMGATSFLLEISEDSFAKAPEKIEEAFEEILKWIQKREAEKRGSEASSW